MKIVFYNDYIYNYELLFWIIIILIIILILLTMLFVRKEIEK